MRRVLLCIGVAALGCPRERVVALPASEPSIDAARPPEKVAPPAPSPASAYACSFRMEKSKLPTMEISIDESVDGRATLALGDDGVANGCFVSRWHYRRSESHFSTKSGKNETTTDKRRTAVGARGTWAAAPEGGLDVRFDAVMRDACPPPSSIAPGSSYGKLTLHCIDIDGGDAGVTKLLACTPSEGDWAVRDLLVPLADHPKHEWLVLGETPGIAVHAVYERIMGLSTTFPEPAPKLDLQLAKATVTLTLKDWLAD
jgi:hypothetical protein